MPDPRTDPAFSDGIAGVVERRYVRDALTELSQEVVDELLRAIEKFPPLNSTHEGWAVIYEEERELLEHVMENTGTSPDARKEAIQIAAMALRFVYDLIDLTDLPASERHPS